MNSSKQQEFSNHKSPTFRRVCRSGGVSKLLNWRVFHVIDPMNTSPYDSSVYGEEFITTDAQLLERGLALPDIPTLKRRFFLWEKLRKYISPNIKIWWPLDTFSDTEILEVDKRITKVAAHIDGEYFMENLIDDIHKWLSLDELIANASQIQQLEYSHRARKFWFDDGGLTMIQRFQLEYAIARMREKLTFLEGTISLMIQHKVILAIDWEIVDYQKFYRIFRKLDRFQHKNPS